MYNIYSEDRALGLILPRERSYVYNANCIIPVKFLKSITMPKSIVVTEKNCKSYSP